MTAHEYLSQYKTCERQLRFNFMQLENLKALTYSISSPSWGEHVSGTRSTAPPFVKALERYWEQEEKISEEITRLNSLKAEIQSAIEQVSNADERFVLLYRYIQNLTWEDIALELHLSVSSVRRFCKSGLTHIVVPS